MANVKLKIIVTGISILCLAAVLGDSEKSKEAEFIPVIDEVTKGGTDGAKVPVEKQDASENGQGDSTGILPPETQLNSVALGESHFNSKSEPVTQSTSGQPENSAGVPQRNIPEGDKNKDIVTNTREINEKQNVTTETNPEIVNLINVILPANASQGNGTGVTLNETTKSGNASLEKAHKRITCVGKNTTGEPDAKVKVVNSTELLQRLSFKNETHGNCALVLFYAPWCMFCASVAPHYNALARAFPQLDVLAIDAIHFSGLNARFGTIAVPNILVFHNSKAVARFNNSDRTIKSFLTFVSNVTGLEGNTSVEVTDEDYIGPLSSVPTNDHDYLLWLAWTFVLFFSGTMFAKSPLGQRLWNGGLNFGHEHQHID